MRSFKDIHTSTEPYFIAHRGSPTKAHENTLASFEQAIQDGVDAIEFDIRRTRDGVLVIHHDPEIQNATKRICEQDFAEAQRAAEMCGYQLATLNETVATCRNRVAMDIEMKEVGYEDTIVQIVRNEFDFANVLLKSFHDESVVKVKRIVPEATVGLLLGVASPTTIGKRVSELFPERRLKRVRADFVSPHWKLVKFGFLMRMRRLHVPVFVWTIDDLEQARDLIKNGVVGIISNNAGSIRAELKRPDR